MDGAHAGGVQGVEDERSIRVAIADDHALVRGGLALLFRTIDEDAEIVEAGSYQTLFTRLREAPVDLLLLDLLMPGANGAEGIRDLREAFPDIPVVVISMREDVEAIREAIRAGASGFIPKSSTPTVTLGALKLVLAGGIYVPPHVLGLNDAGCGTGETRERPEPPSAPEPAEPAEAQKGGLDLTPRQSEVLSLMSQGYTNKSIAERLGLQPGTVKMHISRILRIMDAENRTTAVARFNALRFRAEDS